MGRIKISMGERGLARTSKRDDFRSYILKYKYLVLVVVLASAYSTLLGGKICTYSWISWSSFIVDESYSNVLNRNKTSGQLNSIATTLEELNESIQNEHLQTTYNNRLGLSDTLIKKFFDGLKMLQKPVVPSWWEDLSPKRFERWWTQVKRRWLSPRTANKLVHPNVGRWFVIGMLLIPPLLLLLQTDLATAICVSAGAGVSALLMTRAPPDPAQALRWVQSDRLLLLAAALSWNAAVCDTGLYDWIAVYAAKCKSSVIVCALWATAAIGAYADHVTCTALLTPLIIRIMEEYQFDPRPVVAAASVLADLSAHLSARAGAFGRALDDELGAGHEPQVWGVLIFCTAAAYFAVVFIIFKPHLYDEDGRIIELQQELYLWERVEASMLLGASAHEFRAHIEWERRALRQKMEQLQAGLPDLPPADKPAQSMKLRNPKLLLWLCAVVGAFAVFKYARAVGLEGSNSEDLLERTVTWAMLALLLLMGPRLPFNCLASRFDITTLLTFAAANFYGNVLVVLRFPEVMVQYIIYPKSVGRNNSETISMCSCTIFWISAALTACMGNAAVRPLATTVRLLRFFPSRATTSPLLIGSIASAATLGHAIGSTAFVVSSPGAQAGAAACAQQGYRLRARAFAPLMLPLMALLLTAARCGLLNYYLFV